MALLWFDGIDVYEADAGLNFQYRGGYTVTYHSVGETQYWPLPKSGEGRFGGYSARIPGNIPNIYKNISMSGNKIIIQVAAKIESLSYTAVTYPLIKVTNNTGADQCFFISASAGGSLHVRDSANTTIASASGIFSNGTYVYLEIVATIANSGTMLVKANGVTVINTTGDFTQSTETADRFALFGCSSTDLSGTHYDDLVVMDGSGSRLNAAIGDSRVDALIPTSDTAQEDFTCLSGSDSYAMLDEAVPGGDDSATTYIYSTTNGHKTLCGMSDLAAGKYVHAVSSYLSAKLSAAGTVTGKNILKSGASTYAGSTHTITYGGATFWYGYWDNWALNPNGDKLWCATDVNSLEAGCELTSTDGPEMRVTRAVLNVLRSTLLQSNSVHSFVIP